MLALPEIMRRVLHLLQKNGFKSLVCLPDTAPISKVQLLVSKEEIAERLKNFDPKKKELSGYLGSYAAIVTGGATGVIINY